MDNKFGYQVCAGEGRGNLRIIATCAAPHGGGGVKTMTPLAKANADFIARACNSYELLVGLARRVATLAPESAELDALVAEANEVLNEAHGRPQ